MQGKARFIQSVIAAAIMALVMTAVVTFVNVGIPPDYLRRWMIAYAVAWPVGSVVGFFAAPIAQRATARMLGMRQS